MSKLSLSKVWEETKAVIAHDGKLLTSVALALIVLPAAVFTAVFPGGMATATMGAIQTGSLLTLVPVLIVLLVMLTGQLALTRLAIGPSVSVGGAISHAARRLPVFVAFALIVGAAMFLVVLVAAVAVAATAGAGATEAQLAKSPMALALTLFLIASYLFLLTRIIALAASFTSTEPVGPLRIIQRSWALTSGNFWRLLAFLALFLVSTGIALFALGSVSVVAIQLLLGKIESMSASALVLALIEAVASGAVTAVFTVMLARIYVQLAHGGGTQASVPRSGI
jgi:hypothetical protein